MKTPPQPAKPPYSGTVYRVWHKITGRWYAHIRNENSYKIRTYAKYVYETHHGRILSREDTVDHINDDRTDDRIENLQVLSHADNIRKYARKYSPATILELRCPSCGVVFTRRRGDTHVVKGGIYTACSRSCAARFSHATGSEKKNSISCNIIREFTSVADGADYTRLTAGSIPAARTITHVGEPDPSYFLNNRVARELPKCVDCGVVVSRKSLRCVSCTNAHAKKLGTYTRHRYPSDDELVRLVRSSSMNRVAKGIGVSFTGLKKYMRRRGLA